MRGYNADTMLRLARCDLADSVALEQFLKSCNRAAYERYQTATPGPIFEAAFAGAGIFAFIFMIAMSSGGWAGCGFVIALVALAVMGLICMAVSDLRILRSVRRALDGARSATT